MMERTFEAKLIECLSALEDHEPLEEILARYPEDASALRGILRTAIMVERTRPEPNIAAQARSRAAFLSQAEDLRVTAAIVPNRRRLFRFPALEAFALILVIAGLVGVLYTAAGAALPGTSLYGAKLQLETLRLDLAPGTSEQNALATQFAQTRIEEVQTLLRNNVPADVTFSGTIEGIESTQWQVASIPVVIQATTRITGAPAVGLVAYVAGHTERGMLFATEILIEGAIKLTPTPTLPGGQSEFNPGEPSPTPTNTALPTQPVIVLPTVTPIPPTETPTIAPTDEPPPPSGGGSGGGTGGSSNTNENTNQNSNDNEDSHSGNSGPGGGGGDD